jgi:hypothetical protein
VFQYLILKLSILFEAYMAVYLKKYLDKLNTIFAQWFGKYYSHNAKQKPYEETYTHMVGGAKSSSFCEPKKCYLNER